MNVVASCKCQFCHCMDLKSNVNNVWGNTDLNQVFFFPILIISSPASGSGWMLGQYSSSPESWENSHSGQSTRQDPGGYCLLWLSSYLLLVKGSFLGICFLTLMCREWVEILFIFSSMWAITGVERLE